ncbi:hypothetical protein GCK72_017488 [Caenorhabditis remanei]|uniref:Poly(A) RNA polymerase mitochondrial-like central palm domain-containing protein n=1 Tax=Caenorhabditis remanei TaxID=31234 RepID=A0A6A5G7F8_CAERE|nr:hypothetical protein GCK72_017488 [Caenorhabditis remanei]KAF1750937.1 hypothetical protein GCK72_017488 [Caenorhabditis remanei]
MNCFDKTDVRLVPIGSAANLLLNNRSDLDLVFLPSNDSKQWKDFMKQFSGNSQFRNSFLKNTYKQLRSKRVGNVDYPYFNARIPIIRLFSKRKLQVDIQFGNIEPIRSSLFVRTCVEYDERVALLIHWLTNKFLESKILKSSDNLFSRYHVNMLVIHFLQAMPYPVLPDIISLSPWLSKNNDWNNAVKVLTRQGSLYVPSNSDAPNENSVGELVIQMIDYYSQIDFRKMGIDTRGRVFKKTDNCNATFQIVDDYFDVSSTCRVQESPQFLTRLFEKLKLAVKEENYEKLFHYYTLPKKPVLTMF